MSTPVVGESGDEGETSSRFGVRSGLAYDWLLVTGIVHGKAQRAPGETDMDLDRTVVGGRRLDGVPGEFGHHEFRGGSGVVVDTDCGELPAERLPGERHAAR
ncbi:hypothetical protein SAMN05421773_106220 [Streptomyces aidingensis]|uniref:Uncharacterized protein n=1 Tax=Streptomyces aidingensis TaxID=910347 RepID=A0A1I1MQD9_9ACTN|nr:hypothetical protein SAMN05421773_106220 [Streptomyces aidingensis]